jgi:hypothetical protein
VTGYYVRVREDGRHQVYVTHNGIDRTDVPHADWSVPKAAIDYALMREADIQPVRPPGEEPTVPLRSGSSPSRLTAAHSLSGSE